MNAHTIKSDFSTVIIIKSFEPISADSAAAFCGDNAAGTVMIRYIEDAKRQANEWYTDLGQIASNAGVKYSAESILDVASAADAIVRYAEDKKADLIVMGTKGRTGVKRFLLGSVASGVVAHAKCSVLVVR